MKYNPQGLTPTRIKRKENNNSGNSLIGIRPSRKDYIQKFTNYPVSIIYFKNDKLRIHDISKPVALFEYLIKTYTNENDLVMDCVVGSGTTAIACLNTKRNFICNDISKEYVRTTNERLNEALSNSSPPVRTSDKSDTKVGFNTDLKEVQKWTSQIVLRTTSLNL